MRRVKQTIRFDVAAPLLSMALVMLLPWWLHLETAATSPFPTQRHELIKQAVAQAPFRIGRWIGTDVPLTEAAGRSLRPTASLSRRYVHIDDGYALEFSIIHSGDARDMVGHHPPVCYPSHGWAHANPGTGAVHEEAAELSSIGIAPRRYEFLRNNADHSSSHIRVLSFFVLPDGSLTSDIQDVRRQVSWLNRSAPGAAHIQLVTHADLPEAVARDAANEIIGGLAHVFESMGVITNGTSP